MIIIKKKLLTGNNYEQEIAEQICGAFESGKIKDYTAET